MVFRWVRLQVAIESMVGGGSGDGNSKGVVKEEKVEDYSSTIRLRDHVRSSSACSCLTRKRRRKEERLEVVVARVLSQQEEGDKNGGTGNNLNSRVRVGPVFGSGSSRSKPSQRET